MTVITSAFAAIFLALLSSDGVNGATSKKPTQTPSFRPSKTPTSSPTVGIHYYTLTVSKQMMFINEAFKMVVLINGQTPGPELRVPLGDFLDVTVINALGDDKTTMHWHGSYLLY
jgi:FtsP/CotA-like multicopper oxidase with cupredoxin domain